MVDRFRRDRQAMTDGCRSERTYRSPRRPYPLNQCALFRVRSRKRLFKLLQTSEDGLERLLVAPDRYRSFNVPKADGTHRTITAPSHGLKRVQRRVAELLARVETPDYLFAPARGRSYIENAAKHRHAQAFRLLDVEDYFPSCTGNKVAELFSRTFQCAPDVVALLVRVTTHNGVLPQGSPASSFLAFMAYRTMWDEIEGHARALGVTLTVYADDITLSGRAVPRALVHSVKQSLKHHGHRYSETKELSATNAPILITGVIVRGGSLLIPNVQHHRLHEIRKALVRAETPKERLKLERSAKGRETQMQQIDRANNSVILKTSR